MTDFKLESAMSCIKEYLPPQIMSFVDSQVKMSQRTKQGYRWEMKDKMLAMSVFFHSKKAYKILSRFFFLPSERTLQRDLQKMNMKPGFIDLLLEALKLKVSTMVEMDKNVALVFDEMSIKQGLVFNESQDTVEGFEDYGVIGTTKYIANHTIAFIVCGLASKWKQPVAYFLTSGPIQATKLQSLAKDCIRKLTEVGLNVVTLVCDQGSNNKSFLQTLEKVSITRPYMEVDGRKIFIFYDPPHLLKNVRNNLKKADLQVGDNMVSWQHIVDFYNFDKSQKIQMAPKLKDKHIDLPPFASMRVNLAAQVLSHTVAAGISTLVLLKQLPEDAKCTAEFIEHFDVLFNSFNSHNYKSSQKMGNAFSDKSGHDKFLRESFKLLDTIKKKGGDELPCIFGWKLNIVSLFGLWEYLKKEQGFKFLLTSRLNQDCAENLFSVICGMDGHRDNPDVTQLKACFKYVVADQLFVQSHLSNCQVDNDKMLLNISNIDMATYEKAVPEEIEPPPTADVAMVMTPPLSEEEQNVGAYLAGYLL